MVSRALRLFGQGMAVLCLFASIGVVFFASFEQLARSGGVRNAGGGDLFVGLVAVFGEPGVRLMVGAMFIGLAYLFWRSSSSRKQGRRAS